MWIKGKALITLKDLETGQIDAWEGANSVVDDGLNLLLERLIGTTGASPMAYLAVGSGTGSFTGSESTMYNEDSPLLKRTAQYANWGSSTPLRMALCLPTSRLIHLGLRQVGRKWLSQSHTR